MISTTNTLWIVFGVAVTIMLVIDLRVFHRKAHEVRLREAAIWSVVWIATALVFALFIASETGWASATTFLTGYVVEKALSMDNLFVFLVIFSYFQIPDKHQHSVLFWGIIGALIFRALFIAAGVTLINTFAWTIYVLGAFLIYTGIKLFRDHGSDVHPETNPLLRWFKKHFPVTDVLHGDKFFISSGGRIVATPLFITLLVVETTDIVFATDSIPAILGITTDPFLVYTSNVFAILGLRALYFVLAGVMGMFRYLHYGLALILIFVGLKMLSQDLIHMGVVLELGIVLGILIIAVAASIIAQKREAGAVES